MDHDSIQSLDHVHLVQKISIFVLDVINDILLPKLFWPTVRKKSDWEKVLKLENEGREFANILKSLEQLFKLWKVRTIFGKIMLF